MEKEYREAAKQCLKFIEKSVSCFHVIANAEKKLKKEGYVELRERDVWDLRTGQGYFVKRNDSSMIAFRLPEKEAKGFHIVASHSDSPSFRLKAESEVTLENHYVKLNAEPYGGAFYASWLDRSLSVAGRIVCCEGDELKSRTVNVDEDLLVIPSLAVHMNREVNKNLSCNPQTDLQPLLSAGKSDKEDDERGLLLGKVAFSAGVEKDQILGMDLFLYVREKGRLAGAEGELMLSPRLDDLECVFASLEGFLGAVPEKYINLCAIFDNEEVGSHTKQGAASTFLKDTLERIGEGLDRSGSEYLRMLADSFMVSADNAHGVHPNHPEKSDPTNRTYPNQGIVIKYSGAQKYTTDAYSEAVIKHICEKEQIPCQFFCNRSDMAGGSTLGNISAGQVSIPTADIGLAQLAMHSAVETAGSRDVEYLIRFAKAFYAQ